VRPQRRPCRGSFEIGKSSVISLLSAHVRGLPLVIVAPAGDYDSARPSAALAVRADSPLRSGADFNGKTVAVSALNDSFSLSMRTWVDAHGGDASTLKLIEIPMSASAAAHCERTHRCGRAHPAISPAALESGAIRVLGDPVSAFGNHHTDSAWFTTTAFAQRNPDVVNASCGRSATPPRT